MHKSPSSGHGLQADVDRLQAVADQRLTDWQQSAPKWDVKQGTPSDSHFDTEEQWERKSVSLMPSPPKLYGHGAEQSTSLHYAVVDDS